MGVENEGSRRFWGKETHLREIFFLFFGEEAKRRKDGSGE